LPCFTVADTKMNTKSLKNKESTNKRGATVLSPGEFPLGSLQSRAAARLCLQETDTGKGSSACICFPDDEQPFFRTRCLSAIAMSSTRSTLRHPAHDAHLRCQMAVGERGELASPPDSALSITRHGRPVCHPSLANPHSRSTDLQV
jgi:hypothetical protein